MPMVRFQHSADMPTQTLRCDEVRELCQVTHKCDATRCVSLDPSQTLCEVLFRMYIHIYIHVYIFTYNKYSVMYKYIYNIYIYIYIYCVYMSHYIYHTQIPADSSSRRISWARLREITPFNISFTTSFQGPSTSALL